MSNLNDDLGLFVIVHTNSDGKESFFERIEQNPISELATPIVHFTKTNPRIFRHYMEAASYKIDILSALDILDIFLEIKRLTIEE